MTTYDVYLTHGEDASEVALETYRQWVAFALGVDSVNGLTLKKPSGKLAESIKMESEGPTTVAVFSDNKVSDIMETGHPSFSLKDKMLQKDARISKSGHRYRYIPGGMIEDGTRFGMASNGMSKAEARSYLSLFASGRNAKIPLLHAVAREKGNVLTMSDAPGTSPWQIPAMPAYAPAKYYADLIRKGEMS